MTVPIFPKKTKAFALAGMGDAWSAVGDYSRSIDYYKLALQIDPNNVPALSGMGDTYTEMRAYEKTIEFYDKVIALSPEGRNGYNQRGMAYKELGTNREALRDFHKAIQLAPKDQDTKKEILAILLKMGLQSEDAQATYLQKEGFNEGEIKSILRLRSQ